MIFKKCLGALAVAAALVCGTETGQAATFSLTADGDYQSDFTREYHFAFTNKGITEDNIDIIPSFQVVLFEGDDSNEWTTSVNASYSVDQYGDVPYSYTQSGYIGNCDSSCRYLLQGNSNSLTSLGMTGFVLKLFKSIEGDRSNIEWMTLSLDIIIPDALGACLVNTPTPDPTPLPGALPLFASVLGVGGWLRYGRNRSRSGNKVVAA